ncbi:MAG: RNA-guided pseudouridylation complex pseudouridine synthase subunit Cbf5 [Halobacteria archaeon]
MVDEAIDDVDCSSGDIHEFADGMVVNIDKPRGPSSHQVASWVADIFGLDKASHTGTLDPVVTGCLPFFLGRGSGAVRLFQGDVKEYVFVLELHGDVTETRLEEVMSEFEGVIYQKPPVKSGVKRRIREREVEELELLEYDRGEGRALVECRCGAGTYIRKLCHDVGLVIGTGAQMRELRRTASGVFDVEDSVYLQDLEDAVAAESKDGSSVKEGDFGLDAVLTPMYDVLERKGVPFVTVNESARESLSNGSPLYSPGVAHTEGTENTIGEVGSGVTAAAVSWQREVLAIGKYRPDEEPVFLPQNVFY